MSKFYYNKKHRHYKNKKITSVSRLYRFGIYEEGGCVLFGAFEFLHQSINQCAISLLIMERIFLIFFNFPGDAEDDAKPGKKNSGFFRKRSKKNRRKKKFRSFRHWRRRVSIPLPLAY